MQVGNNCFLIEACLPNGHKITGDASAEVRPVEYGFLKTIDIQATLKCKNLELLSALLAGDKIVEITLTRKNEGWSLVCDSAILSMKENNFYGSLEVDFCTVGAVEFRSAEDNV